MTFRYWKFLLRAWFERLLNYILRRKYWLSFIEEYWRVQIEGTFIGRIEVFTKEGEWELRIYTYNADAVEKLRVKYDFKTVTKKVYLNIKRVVAELNTIVPLDNKEDK